MLLGWYGAQAKAAVARQLQCRVAVCPSPRVKSAVQRGEEEGERGEERCAESVVQCVCRGASRAGVRFSYCVSVLLNTLDLGWVLRLTALGLVLVVLVLDLRVLNFISCFEQIFESLTLHEQDVAKHLRVNLNNLDPWAAGLKGKSPQRDSSYSSGGALLTPCRVETTPSTLNCLICGQFHRAPWADAINAAFWPF